MLRLTTALPRSRRTATSGGRRRSRVRHIIEALVVVVMIGVVPIGAPPASSRTLRTITSGSIGLRLLDIPATSSEDPRAQIYIVDRLAPGTTIQRRVEVSNTTAAAMHVALYPAAATIAHGSFVGADGHTANELSTWASVGPEATDVVAQGRATATVTISVPADAAPGERYGVVWAEARSAPRDGSGLTQVNRVGIRLYVSVGPGGPPAADFGIDSLHAGRTVRGRPMVVAMVHNTGGRALDMNGSLQLLHGPGGLRAGPFPANLGTTLAIGDAEPVTITLDRRLPAGPWSAHIILRSGLLERDARALLTFPASGTSPAVLTRSSGHDWPLIALIAALAVLVLGSAALIVWRRRHGSLVRARGSGGAEA